MGIESIQDLYAFIEKEEAHIDLGHIENVRENSVDCGDPLLNSSASWRLVGGAAYLFVKGHLEKYISRREGGSGILSAHLACGWMFTQGFQTYESQSDLIIATRQCIEELNQRHGTSFTVPEPQVHGSAAPFMIGIKP